MAARTDPNYWMGMLNSPMGQQLAMEGADALQSGEVTEEQLSPLLRAAGITPRKPSLLDVSRRRKPQATPVPRASGLSNSEEVKTADSATNTLSNEGKQQDLSFMSPAQLQGLYDQTARMPAFQDQARGIASQRELMQIASEAPSDYLSGPLAGLLQTEFGRNTGTMAQMAGETPAQKRANILNMGAKLQDDRKDLSNSIFDAIGKQRAGYMLNTLGDKMILKSEVAQTAKAAAEDPRKTEKVGKSGKGYDVTKDLAAHQKRMQDLEPVRQAYETLTRELGLEKWNGKDDIPGMGGTGKLPAFLLTNKGANIRTKYKKLEGVVLKAESGGQVTGSEAARLLSALGTGSFNTDREFVEAIEDFGNTFQDVMRQREAAVFGAPQGKIVKEAYLKGGARTSDSFVPAKRMQKPEGAKKPMTFEEWKAAGKPKAGG